MTIKEITKTFHDLIYENKDSGLYKYAKTQFLRLLSPFVSFICVSIMIALLFALCVSDTSEKIHVAEVVAQELQVEEVEEVPEIDSEIETEIEIDDTFDIAADVSTPNVAKVSTQPTSAKPASFNAVALVKSPMMMPGIYGARTTGQIGAARAKHGGTAAGEKSVLRALRWLKTKQNADGSWSANRPAMTGLALLTFLAHGEVPGRPEFGDCVRRGIEYLMRSQDKNGFFIGEDGNKYAHHIATYALCEAYAMTRNPELKEVAEKALIPIIKGQHANGCWDYKIAITDRDDTSVMGWASQAIKAGYNAGDLLNDHGEYEEFTTTDGRLTSLKNAYKLAPRGFLKNYNEVSGGFGYTGKSPTGLSAVGALCMQLMGQGSHEAVRKTAKRIEKWTLDWGKDRAKMEGACPQYYAYYATQMAFQISGEYWNRWNKTMSELYPRVQKVISKEASGYRDHRGELQEIGYWENDDAHSDRPVMDTCLTCLQMEVYYRYLPTYEIVKVEDADVILSDKTEDVAVEIEF